MPTWKNVPGLFSVEVTATNGQACEFEGSPLPMLSCFITLGEVWELVIEFTSSGYYQPMSMYGGADRLGWPQEGSDERELVRAYLLDGKTEIELPLEVQKQLFEHYQKQIDEVELTWEEA